MATYNNIYQSNINGLSIPDEGQVFKDSNNAYNIYQRQGNKIYSYDLSKIGGSEGLSQYGVNVKDLPNYAMGNVQTVFGTNNGLSATPGDWANFKYSAVAPSNEVITQSLSSVNPQASDLNSSIYGNLRTAPSLQSVLSGAAASNGLTGEAATNAIAQATTQATGSTFSPEYYKQGGTPPTFSQYNTLQANAPQVTSLNAPPKTYKSLVDIASSRPDVLNTAKSQGGDPFTQGTKANTWLNDWWNSAGKNEYPQYDTTLTPESLKSGQGVTLPGATGNNAADSLVAGATAYSNQLGTQLTATQTKEQGILDMMSSLVGNEANKGADQLAAEQSAGLPQLNKQLADINGQILTKTAEYEALKADQEGKPVTMNSIIGATAQIEHVKASEIGMLTAQAQALQGNIQVAQDTVNRAIDLKYSTIEAQLNVYQAQLNALQPTLDREEKAQAAAQQAILDEKNAKVADAKATENQQTSYALEAMGAYIDAGIQITDDYGTVNKKVQNSASYKASIAPKATSSGSSNPTDSEQKASLISQATEGFESVKGGDGYVSPQDWQAMRATWLASGGILKDFLDNFKFYVNPADPQDYGFTPSTTKASTASTGLDFTTF